MSNESTKKMMFVALGVCLVCSVLVSTAAVSLHARQQRNKELDKIKNILIAGDLYEKGVDSEQIFKEKVEPLHIDLSTGAILDENEVPDKLSVTKFNIKDISEDPDYGQFIEKDKDIARINRMPGVMLVYVIKSDDKIDKYILPIYGKGLWSTLYGFIALDSDLETIQGITFYEHGETPGLGGEVDNPNWKEIWVGKKAFNEQGNVAITVIKGQVDPTSPKAKYQVDGLSGSTLTTRGLDAMVKFWFGESGYGPFIKNKKSEKGESNEQS